MAKHTEGPWTSHELEDGRFSVVHWGPLAYVGADEPGVAEANATLMAAAPDLLDACYAALNLEAAARIGSMDGALKGLDVQYHFDQIRAAIANA